MSENFKEQFDELFGKYKNSPIMLYGYGRNAEVIINVANDYNILGIIANEFLGEERYGKKIYAIEEAVNMTDIIIIAAVASSTGIIYQRIKDKIPSHVMVFDMRGTHMNMDAYYTRNAYWEQTEEKLYYQIENHDVVSFDIFDTLITRGVTNPHDIFYILEKQAISKYGSIYEKFADKRIAAECELYGEGSNPTIDDIYEKIKEMFGASNETLQLVLNIERELELEYVRPRKTMIDILKMALERGKEVVLTSDMYLSSEDIFRLLEKCGINDRLPIYLSCERDANKISGKLYRILIEDYSSKNIIHIGNDYLVDVKIPMEIGIDVFQILSGYDMLALSSAAYILDSVETLDDRRMLGEIISRFFDSPFSLAKTSGKLYISTIEQLTDLALSSIFVGFLAFIVKMASRIDSKAVILFSSRDCYYFYKKYCDVRSYNEKDLPEARYFYISRTAARSAAVQSIEDIEILCEKLKEIDGINIGEYLEEQFQVSLSEKLDRVITEPLSDDEYATIIEIVLRDKERIINKSKELRKNYLKYIKSLNIFADSDVYLTDAVTQGSLVYSLSNILGKKVRLFAIGTSCVPNGYLQDLSLVESIYGNVFTKEGKNVISLSEMSTFFKILEMVYASAEEQLKKIDENGHPVFDNGTKYSSELLYKIQNELDALIMNELPDDWYKFNLSRKYMLAMLRVLRKEYSDIVPDVLDLFQFSDSFENNKVFNLLMSIR